MKDKLVYDFYECQGCFLGYAVEADQLDEPACPSCGETDARYVTTRDFEV